MRGLAAALLALPLLLRPEDLPRPYAPWAPLDLAAAPNFVTPLKLALLDGDPAACLAALRGVGAVVEPLADRDFGGGCALIGAVRLSRLGPVTLAPVDTRCGIAARLALWTRHDLDPAARAAYGSPVARIEHYSSYACRPIRTSRGEGGALSQHATGNAFDIAGIALADGRRISVARDWGTPFLRAARDGLCARFRLVLSPDYNALHADHFHVDQGRAMACR